MSLRDRIEAEWASEKTNEEYRSAVAQLATEADELMSEMAEALVALRHEMMESGNYHAVDFGWPDAKQKTNAAIERYNTYKERNNEQ